MSCWIKATRPLLLSNILELIAENERRTRSLFITEQNTRPLFVFVLERLTYN